MRFYDPYHLLSRETRDRLQKEVVLAFEASEIGLRFVGRGGPGVIPATLYPELPDRWDVAPEAIGVAIGAQGERRSIFLSLGAAERALGLPLVRRTEWNRKEKRAKRHLAGSQPAASESPSAASSPTNSPTRSPPNAPTRRAV